MTDGQRLALAIQREIGESDMQTLALNSLRWKMTLGRDEAAHQAGEIAKIDRRIMDSVPDDGLRRNPIREPDRDTR